MRSTLLDRAAPAIFSKGQWAFFDPRSEESEGAMDEKKPGWGTPDERELVRGLLGDLTPGEAIETLRARVEMKAAGVDVLELLRELRGEAVELLRAAVELKKGGADLELRGKRAIVCDFDACTADLVGRVPSPSLLDALREADVQTVAFPPPDGPPDEHGLRPRGRVTLADVGLTPGDTATAFKQAVYRRRQDAKQGKTSRPRARRTKKPALR